jgi:hypothetical protein
MPVEDSVYLAKLAEQAERYEGTYLKTQNTLFTADSEQRWWRT